MKGAAAGTAVEAFGPSRLTRVIGRDRGNLLVTRDFRLESQLGAVDRPQRQNRKRAVTERAFVIVTTHVPRPEQAPLQSRRVPPDVVSVTRVPAGKLAPHTPAEQRRPGIELVTVPGPPVTFTVSVYVLTGGGSGAGRACPESAEIMRLEALTASNALPGMRWNERTRSSCVPGTEP